MLLFLYPVFSRRKKLATGIFAWLKSEIYFEKSNGNFKFTSKHHDKYNYTLKLIQFPPLSWLCLLEVVENSHIANRVYCGKTGFYANVVYTDLFLGQHDKN